LKMGEAAMDSASENDDENKAVTEQHELNFASEAIRP